MCGRFTLQSPADDLVELFEIENRPDVLPRYNIAPTQSVLAVKWDEDEGARDFAKLRWGLIPFFSKDAKMAARMINARAETVATKPSFRAAFKRRRCLVPTDGYFEWKAEADGKQPYHIRLKEGGVFAMAGLFESWTSPEGPVVESCTVITTAANKWLEDLHHRMPAVLDAPDWDMWIDPGVADVDALQALLEPYPRDAFCHGAVSRRVNSPRNDDPECLSPPA